MLGIALAGLLQAAVVEVTPVPPPEPAPPVVPLSWERRMATHLLRFQQYPQAALREELEGTTLVKFRVNREGKVLSATVHRSSGHPALDEEALQSLLRAQPLPAIPADQPDEVDLMLPVMFRMEA